MWLPLCSGQTATLSVAWQVAGCVKLTRSLLLSRHSSKAPYVGSLCRAAHRRKTNDLLQLKQRTRMIISLEHSR